MSTQPQIAVLGAGSWGTALALLLARNGVRVSLWSHSPEHVAAMLSANENSDYLPGRSFPETLSVSADLGVAMQASSLLLAVPSIAFRSVLNQIKPLLRNQHAVFWATKGLDHERSELLHEVAEQILPEATPRGVLSGPTFAEEVANGMPTAITLASTHGQASTQMIEYLCNERFRVYSSEDITGVELGGALKNVLAVAAGISDGLGYGANARAALITRGLAEIMRLGAAIGANPETLMGLTGMGDLVLTCTDNLSRNRRFGLSLGKGVGFDEAKAAIGQAVEGADTAKVVMRMADKHAVDMPICEQVYRVLYENLPPREAVEALFSRQIRAESD